MRTGIMRSAIAALLFSYGPVAAQTVDEIRSVIRQEARDAKIGDSIQSLIGFAAFPRVSAANFEIDTTADNSSDAKAVKFMLPLAQEFKLPEAVPARLHTELTLGYLEIDQSVDDLLAGTAFEANVDTRTQAFSAIGGVGLAFDPLPDTTIRPMALLGYSRIRQRSDFSGPAPTISRI